MARDSLRSLPSSTTGVVVVVVVVVAIVWNGEGGGRLGAGRVGIRFQVQCMSPLPPPVAGLCKQRKNLLSVPETNLISCTMSKRKQTHDMDVDDDSTDEPVRFHLER